MRDQPVTRIMTEPLAFVAPTATPELARLLMSRRSLHHLVVLADGQLVGMLSATDLMDTSAATVTAVSQPDPVALPATAT